LESAWARDTAAGHFAYWMGVVVALMTAFYSWRLLWMTFHGQPRASHDVMHHIHESPFVMLLPLCVLAGGAIFSGWYFYDSFVGHHYLENFWHDSLFVLASNDSVSAAHDVALWVKKLPLVMAGSGIVLACIMYGALPGSSARMRQIFYAPYLLFYNKWWFDEIYDRVFVRTAFALGRVFSVFGDKKIIDGLGPDGSAWASKSVAGLLSRFQTGYIFHYALVMMVGLIGLLTWFVFRPF